MSTIWLISDTHFGHANMLKFKRADGSPLRRFASVDQMDECLCDMWQTVVKPQDKIYHLGDVCMGKRSQAIWRVKGLNGHKRLVLGNHDDLPTKHYLDAGFDKLYSSRRLGGYLLSHMPLLLTDDPRIKGCIHGHLHANLPPVGNYANVSVEMTAYTPIAFDAACQLVGKQRDQA